jgi:hypothetical protein
MMFKLPLRDRQRLAADKRRRYWADPDERLKRINEARRFRGAPELRSLAEIGQPSRTAPRRRDEHGRFAPDGDAA